MLDVRVNEAQLKAVMRKMLAALPEEVRDPAVRKVAFDVLADVQLAIYTGGFGTPKRVDTARYVGGWRMAQSDVSGGGGGPDGYAVVATVGDSTTATLTNAVEYASHVEHGTRFMAPGNHVAVALQRARQDVQQVLTGLMRKMWEGL